MQRKLSKSVSKIDWIIFGIMAVVCFFTFQHGDILHTGGSSFAYLNGRFIDFYDYNKKFIGGNNYLPSTYILFAIWNIPIRLLGWVVEPTMNVEIKVLFWYKLLPTLFFLGSGYLMYKILCELNTKKELAKTGAFIFLSSPIAFFSQFIFGQYDSFTLFFMMLGIYYWIKDDQLRFSIFFGISLTFKYTALLIFVPLLLLREKRYTKIIFSFLLAVSLLMLETAISYSSEAFRGGVLGFGVVNYITNTLINATNFKISIFIVMWIFLCGVAFFQNCDEKTQLYKWGVFLSSLICFLLFGLCQWHPQWLLFITPFLVLGMMFHKNPDAFLLMDFMLMGVLTLIIVDIWPNNVDQNLFSLGIFRDVVAAKSGFPILMRDLLHAPDIVISFSVFSGILLVATFFKHPKYLLNQVSDKIMELGGLIRLRFLGGLATFIIPALVCFGILLMQPDVILSNDEMELTLNPIIEENDIRQYFSVPESTLSEIDVIVGTYARNNNGNLIVELHDAASDTLLAKTTADISRFGDNTPCRIKIPETSLHHSVQYYLKFCLERNSVEDILTFYRNTDGTATETNYAVIDGEITDYNLSVNLYGEKKE